MSRGAVLAARIDPFNALYRVHTGRLGDLRTAVELEPRNVWYRRTLAQFNVDAWNWSRDPNERETALAHYRVILKQAPGIALFTNEFEALENSPNFLNNNPAREKLSPKLRTKAHIDKK